MTSSSVLPRSSRPALVVAAGALGLVAAAVSAVTAFFLLALGGMTSDDGTGRWWVLGLVVAAVLQGWGAVRLLRRSGWLLLALGSLPGLLPLVALVVVRLEYHEGPSPLEVLASVPLLALVLTLLPSVRQWTAADRARRSAGGRRSGAHSG